MGFLDPTAAFSGILPANGQATPALLAQKRRLAEAMMTQGMDASPIASPWQGMARLAQAYVGGTMLNKTNQQEIQGRQDAAAKLGAAMSSDHPDYTAALSNPFIDPSTVVGMANSNRQFGLENQRFNQEKTASDRTYQLQASEAGWKQLADGTFVNILTGQKIDPYGAGGAATAPPNGGNVAPQGQTTAQPIPQPMPPAAPQMPAGANAPDGAGLPQPPSIASPQSPAAQAGPMPAAQGEPNYSGMSQIDILRKRGLPITAENLTAATALREGGQGMSGADLAGGKDFRAEVTGSQPYVNFQEGKSALDGMAANLNDNTIPSNTAFMHSFVQSLAPSKVIKNANGQTQLVSADPETLSAAWQKAKSYLTAEGVLTPDQKQEMLRTAQAQVGSYQNDYHALKQNYTGVAANSGMHYDKIVPDLADVAQQPNNPNNQPNQSGAPKVFNWTPEKGLH
jgi:hypothetical protein